MGNISHTEAVDRFEGCKVRAVSITSPSSFKTATLTCPRTEDLGIKVYTMAEGDFGNTPQAYKKLIDHAADLVCMGCIYSDMDMVEVSEERTRVALAETRRVEALTAQHRAEEELAAFTSN